MIEGEPRKLAVLGSPIAHSKSPALHQAAYSVLGLDWSYQAIEVSEDSLADFISSRDDSWLGLSLTMPLKRAIMPLLDRCEDLAQLTGSTNTVLFGKLGDRHILSGFNTDVYGLAESFRQAGISSLATVQIVGGGATAASAIAAASLLSASDVSVVARNAVSAAPLIALGEALGIRVTLRDFDSIGQATSTTDLPDAIISSLPGGLELPGLFTEQTRRHSILLDVAYDPWPSALARSWIEAQGSVISGIHMLINQALMQIRIFVSGDVTTPLAQEVAVLDAMRAAVGV